MTRRDAFVDQTIAAMAVAKRDQPLRKELHPHRRAVVFRQFLRQNRRSPVAAEQLTHRGTGTRLGDKFVLLFPQHRLLQRWQRGVEKLCAFDKQVL
jgi:hypothetical protein